MANKEEGKYSRNEFIHKSKALFNVNPEIVVGALSQKEQDSFTKKEVEKAIQVFQKRKVGAK